MATISLSCRGVLTCCLVLVSAVVTIAAPNIRAGQSDFRQFSGNWDGDVILMQTGECSIEGGDRSKHRSRLILKVESDGKVVAGEQLPEMTVQAKFDWSGQLSPDLKLKLNAPAIATCRGDTHDYTIENRGKIKQRKGTSELELKGNDHACQRSGCTFQRIYKLTLR